MAKIFVCSDESAIWWISFWCSNERNLHKLLFCFSFHIALLVDASELNVLVVAVIHLLFINVYFGVCAVANFGSKFEELPFLICPCLVLRTLSWWHCCYSTALRPFLVEGALFAPPPPFQFNYDLHLSISNC